MSADLYRAIALTAGNDETACEAAFANANTVLALIKIAPPFVNLLKPGTGVAMYRPISGDGTLFGIALAEQQPINAELLDALTDVFAIGDRLVSDVYGREFVEKARAAITKAKGGVA
jgi:hypothetical protein